jgi:uncharacterized protein YdeI (YjbR/CyaY-like superfamily)
MTNKSIASGVVHKVPDDLRKSLSSNPDILAKWNKPTPLARNEWICWITIVKKSQTRKKHLERLNADLSNGKRRPCCWSGCPHRKEGN